MPAPKPTSVEKTLAKLKTTDDGIAAHKCVDKLRMLAMNGDPAASDALAEYAEHGAMAHVRSYATSALADVVASPAPRYAACFLRLVASEDSSIRYWAIKGLGRAGGEATYPTLLAIALDASSKIDIRGKAVQALSAASGQPFDRQLTSDPAYWKESELRVTEMQTWASSGFPRGSGYAKPDQHPSLDNPQTDFERIVAKSTRSWQRCVARTASPIRETTSCQPTP